MQELVVPAQETAKRLDNFLKKQFPIGYVRKLFRKNGIRLNNQRAKTEDTVRAGDRIQLYIPFEGETFRVTPNRLDPGKIIYEDESLLVINKPAGLAVHEGKSVRRGDSLVGFIEKKYRHNQFRPKLAHRLDKDTSGVLVLAKNQSALSELEREFESGDVEKQYLCLVVGRLPRKEGKIDLPLPGRDGELVRAVTRYRVIKRFAETTLLSVNLETGRLHQIRLHLAKIGYPVVMDDQHGDFSFNKQFRKEYGLKRQFLHAAKLAIDCAGKRHIWIAPLAEDLQKTLKLLERI